MSPQRQSLLYYLTFCLLVLAASLYDLSRAHQQAQTSAAQRVTNASHLIGAWIKGAFESSDYVLRDMAGAISLDELRYPNLEPITFARRIDYLEQRRGSLPNVIYAGYFDQHCVATHAVHAEQIGLDASQRAYCRPFQQDSSLETLVTEAFPALNGPINVTQARRLAPDGSGFRGVAAIAVDLSFFDKWLDLLQISDADWVLIVDTRQTVLAERPIIGTLGKTAGYPWLEEFLSSGESHVLSRKVTAHDDIERLASLRKLDDLPLVVVVAESDRNWLSNWHSRLAWFVFSLLLLWAMGGLALRYYWSALDRQEQLWEVAHIDPLTGVANRRQFLNKAQYELDRHRRHGTGLALLMLDIDYFKQINDTYGHAVGDQAIVAFAKSCRECLRDIDVLGRLGGDEFAIMLPGVDLAGARIVAERLVKAIAATQFAIVDGNTVKITASIGLALAKSPSDSLDALIALADTGLYRAKAGGRNGYALASD